jgi:DinB family protein
VHIAHSNAMYREHVFGPGKLDFDDFEIPHQAAAAAHWWDESYETFRRSLRDAGDAGDAGLDRVVAAPWGDTRTVRGWAEVLVHENIHHGAEVGALRDLHRTRG